MATLPTTLGRPASVPVDARLRPGRRRVHRPPRVTAMSAPSRRGRRRAVAWASSADRKTVNGPARALGPRGNILVPPQLPHPEPRAGGREIGLAGETDHPCLAQPQHRDQLPHRHHRWLRPAHSTETTPAGHCTIKTVYYWCSVRLVHLRGDRQGDGVNAPAADDRRPQRRATAAWTPLAIATGYTHTCRGRTEILTAAGQMTRSDPNRAGRDSIWDDLHLTRATRAVAAAAVGDHLGRSWRVGTAPRPSGRRLIVLHHSCGGRTCLLEDGAEAIHVLTMRSPESARAGTASVRAVRAR